MNFHGFWVDSDGFHSKSTGTPVLSLKVCVESVRLVGLVYC